MPNARPIVLRFSAFTRGASVVGLAFVALMIGIAAKVYIDGSRVLAVVAGAMFLLFGRQLLKQFRNVWSYSIELHHRHIREHFRDRVTSISIESLVRFTEFPIDVKKPSTGYRFALTDGRDQAILFSTQIEGWATLIDELHALRPDVVPASRTLKARTEMNLAEMSPEAAAMTANSRVGELSTDVLRWYDYLIGFVISGVTIVAFATWASVTLRSFGFPKWPVFFVVLLFALFVMTLIMRGYVHWVHTSRISAARRRGPQR